VERNGEDRIEFDEESEQLVHLLLAPGDIHAPRARLFIQSRGAELDLDSKLADPVRAHCPQLEKVVVESGHWMAREKSLEVNSALARWLAVSVPNVWAR